MFKVLLVELLLLCIIWGFFPPYVYYLIVPMGMCLVALVVSDFCDPVDSSPPGSSVHGILQASVLEWVVISLSRESSPPKDQT